MVRMILASHGELATGMKNSLKMIIGDVSQVEALAAYGDDGVNFREAIEERLNGKRDDEVLVIATDIPGGSVNTEVMDLARKRKNVFVVTGMNLPLILEIATAGDSVDGDRINGALRQARESMKNCSELYFQMG